MGANKDKEMFRAKNAKESEKLPLRSLRFCARQKIEKVREKVYYKIRNKIVFIECFVLFVVNEYF
jgi:hypothetical protein